MKNLLSEFLEDVEIGQGRAAKTVENYHRYLKKYFDQQKISDISDIDLNTLRNFRQYLNEVAQVSTHTQNYHFIAIRQFLKYLAKKDIPALSPEKVGLAKTGDRDIDILHIEELQKLLESAQDKDARDYAILQVLFSTGMRVSELVSLNRDDITEDGEIIVRGKGNKIRVVFLSPESQASIENYLAKRTDTDPALFIRKLKKNEVIDADDELRLTPRSVQRLIKKYAALAGITKSITPHTLRHSFATDMLKNGADVRHVQHLLGHASITTTQVYTHLTDAHLKQVHQKYHNRLKGS